MDRADHPMKVAVASSDGLRIDQHFGHADAFRIYALDKDGARFLESRSIEHYCRGGGLEEDGEDERRAVILRAIADCAALFVARVGVGPTRLLREAGIMPIADHAHEELETSLRTWFEQTQG